MDVVGRGASDWLENRSEYTFSTTSMGGLIGHAARREAQFADAQWKHPARHIDREFPLGPDLLRGIDLWSVWSKLSCPILVWATRPR
ncbi:MAG TPA: hypothetical protein VML57_21040 [Burkholderiales bacterium]|nr:hypothetical protein [Burkholderiales bacterium]